ncbi:MAG: hypothetical protein ABH822_02025 [Patescibacteria group bacterium]
MLEILEKVATSSVRSVDDFVEKFNEISLAPGNYGPTGVVKRIEATPKQSKEAREAERHRNFLGGLKEKEKLHQKERRKRQKEIHRLVKDGFVEKKKNSFNLTARGEDKRKRLKLSVLKQLLFNNDFKKVKERKVIIVSFDIPEKYRAVRDWIRKYLKFLGYEMIHQSVWCGRTRLPSEFMEFLSALDMDQYIKIFSIDHEGNLNTGKM